MLPHSLGWNDSLVEKWNNLIFLPSCQRHTGSIRSNRRSFANLLAGYLSAFSHVSPGALLRLGIRYLIRSLSFALRHAGPVANGGFETFQRFELNLQNITVAKVQSCSALARVGGWLTRWCYGTPANRQTSCVCPVGQGNTRCAYWQQFKVS